MTTTPVRFRDSALRDPARGTVVRRSGSARRTSHVDMVATGPTTGQGLALRARARDLRTDADAIAAVVDESTLAADLGPGHELRRLETEPAIPSRRRLLGRRVRHGFRGALAEICPEVLESQSPLALLLDDLPVAALIAGYADMHARPVDLGQHRAPVDVCAGWASDASMMREVEATGTMTLIIGPTAPDLAGTDALAWHVMDPLEEGAMRRRRLVDVALGDTLDVGAMFRDSHVGPDGAERVLHEYELEAEVDPHSGTVLRCEARPRALPWPECPRAAASAGWIAGRPVSAVRPFVRSDLRGTATCTHLNDLLRSLADVVPLARALGIELPAGR